MESSSMNTSRSSAYSLEYKSQILEELDAYPEREEAILLREGVTSEEVMQWRRERYRRRAGGDVPAAKRLNWRKDGERSRGITKAQGHLEVAQGPYRFAEADLIDADGAQLKDILGALWRGKYLILLLVMAVMSIAMVGLRYVSPVYTGRALIMLERPQKVQGIETETGQAGDPETIETEMRVMLSHNIADKIVDQFKLSESPEFNLSMREHGVPGKLSESVRALFNRKKDGATEKLRSQSERFAGSGTVSFWMRTNGVWGTSQRDPQNRAAILSRFDESGSGLLVAQWPLGAIIVQAQGPDGKSVCELFGPVVRDNAWHQIAVVYSRAASGEMKLYVDGAEAATCKNNATWSFHGAPFILGNSNDEYWEHWNGSLDELKIYSGALSKSEIADLYADRKTEDASKLANDATRALVGQWDFDEKDGNAIIDDTEGRNVGELVSGWQRVPGRAGFAIGFVGEEGKAVIPSSTRYDAINQSALVDEFLEHVRVSQEGKSRIISVQVTAGDPVLVAKITNGLAEAYISDQLEAKFRLIRRTNEWLKERISILRQEVTNAETEVENLRNSSGAPDLMTKNAAGMVSQEASQINSQLLDARTQLRAAEARLREAKRQPITLDSGLLHGLREKLAEIDRAIAEHAQSHGPEHPRSRTLRAQRESLLAQVNRETGSNISSLENEANILRSKVASLEENANSLKVRAASANKADVKVRAIEREAAAARALLESFLQRYQVTTSYLDTQTPNARIISSAEVPSEPSFPRVGPVLGLSLLGALVLGVIAVLVRELFAKGFRTSEELESRFGLPVLATIPKLSFWSKWRSEQSNQYVSADKKSAFTGAIHALVRGISLLRLNPAPKRILVTSSFWGEGKSLIASAIARVLALSGRKVVLLTLADKPTRDDRGDRNLGFSDYLAQKASIEDIIQKDVRSPMDLICPGTAGDIGFLNIFEEGELIGNLLSELEKRYDFVIINAAPILTEADAMVIGDKVDLVILAVKSIKTDRTVVSRALDRLAVCRTPVGLALSMTDSST